MQVNSIQFQETRKQPQFTAIKSLKCRGLYKDYPKLGMELVDTFKRNPEVIRFCKKYDVDVVFYAAKQIISDVSSEIHIFYNDVSRSRIGKLFKGSKDDVNISGYGSKSSITDSIMESTNNLKSYISPYIKENLTGGILESHLSNADKRIQEILDKKAQVKQDKAMRKLASENTSNELKNDKNALDKSVKDLIDETNK